MKDGYFHRVARETPTRLWVNNPTLAEADLAIAAGAVAATTNPTYAINQIRRDPATALPIVDACLKEFSSDAVAADQIQQKLVARILERFLPLYEKDKGATKGFVSIQGDPGADTDSAHIIEEALRYRRLGPNVIAKLPVTRAGLKAIEYLIAEDVPVLATEIFGISQAVATCELYRRISQKCGKRPPLFYTHISGIFDDYLGAWVKKEDVDISPDVLSQAGCAIAKAQYRFCRDKGYDGIMMGGGARGTHHFTEMVGGAMDVTVNWSTAEELLAMNPPATNRMDAPFQKAILDELTAKLPDFRKAMNPAGLSVEEFEDFGPVQLFRSYFMEGWQSLLDTVRERRRQEVPV